MKRAASTSSLLTVPTTPRVGLLLRLSKADDDTIAVQDTNARRFSAEMFPEIPVDDVFADNGVTGDDWDKRTALGRMMAWLRPGDIVIARDAARLGREIVESLNFIREICQRKQARLFYYQSRKETRADNPTDWVINAVEAFGAESEHKKIIENTTAKFLQVVARINAGELRPDRVINGGCYGYRIIEIDGEPIGVVHEAEAKIVRLIYLWSLDGMGLRQIAARLNANGVPAPYSDRKRKRAANKWAARTVGDILQNERYKGLHVWGRTATDRKTGRKQKIERAEPLLNKYVPSWRIVGDDHWDAVQDVRVARRTNPNQTTGKGSRKPSAKYPLSGIARCASCGGSIHVRSWVRKVSSRRWTAYNYGCSTHHSKGAAACAMRHRQVIEEVEGAVVERIAQEYLSPAHIEQLIELVKAAMERRLGKPTSGVDALQKEIVTLRKRLDSIAEAMLEVDDRRAFAAKHKETSARLKEAERELADAWKAPKERQAAITGAAEGVRRYCANLLANLEGADRKLKRQAFEALFPAGLYFAPVPVPKGTPLPKKSSRKTIFRIEGDADVASAIVNSGGNSFLKRAEMTTPTTRKDAKRMVVLALPRAA